MNPAICEPPAGPEDDFSCATLAAYAAALSIHLADFTPDLAKAAKSTLIALAYSDAEAAIQAGMSLEDMAHDRVTLDATDGLPLVITSITKQGRFYFSRPSRGWPRPGHRRYT